MGGRGGISNPCEFAFSTINRESRTRNSFPGDFSKGGPAFSALAVLGCRVAAKEVRFA